MCAGVSPLRIHRSVGWIQRRTRKLLRSDRNRVGVLFVPFIISRSFLGSITQRQAIIYIPHSLVQPCSGFSDTRWRPPLFPGSLAAGPSAPPSPSSPPPGPLGSPPCRPAPAAFLLGQFTPVGRKENSRNLQWRPESSYPACSLSQRWSG